ncbi:C40 family peptidase [soil metagenome]
MGDMVTINRRRMLFAFLVAIIVSGTLLLSVAADWDLGAGDSARVAYTSGDGINLRAAPGGEVISWLSEGYPVIVQDGIWLDDGSYWYAVSVDLDWGWTTGWILADYLAGDTSFSTFAYEGDAAASDVPITVTAVGAVNMRANPWSSAGVLTSIPEGSWVEVLAPSIYDDAGVAWSQIRYAGMVGYAASDYLGYKVFGGSAASELWIGSPAVVGGTGGDGVYLRDDVYGTPLAVLPEGAASEVIDGPLYDADGAAWWMIATDYGNGWSHGGYLAAMTWSELAAGTSGNGSALANAAMAYIGTPYLWAGITPNGFDCSGFTYYLMTSILGYDFPRQTELQMESGFEVGIDELQPGDLIFFRNTYTWGLSHVGIYIGNGQMISASGEHGGVGINDLNDPYWSARYLTARRVL